MEKQAISKYLRISAEKARHVARLIQGKPVVEALALTELSPRKAASLVGKTLRSALANCENDDRLGVDASDLWVKEATVGEGPTMKRFRPKARGMAGRVHKRTSHVKIVLTDEI